MSETKYPLPAFHFKVSWKDKESVLFSEVSGLNANVEVIEYRHGESKEFSTIKMPGMKKYSNVTLKRGTIAGDNSLFDWWNSINLNQVERRTVTISLLNEKHEPAVTWTLNNAFPMKIDSGSMNAKTNDVLIESVELAYESLKIEHVKQEEKKEEDK